MMTSKNRSSYTTRRNTPPVRKRKRKSFWQTTLVPLLRICVITIIVFTAVGMLWQRFTYPIKQYQMQSELNRQAEADLAKYQQQSKEIERQIQYTRTPEGTAQAARKLGLVKPGEVKIVLPEDTPVKQNN